MCKANAADEWEKEVKGKGGTFTGVFEISVCLSKSLVTYICLLVIPLPEPEDSYKS